MMLEILCTFNGIPWLLILLSLRYSTTCRANRKAHTSICKISFLNKGVELINAPDVLS